MSHEAKIHPAQTQILRELLFLPSANFAKLSEATKLGSDHAKFHIRRLLELGYIQKSKWEYSLTTKGKEYANKLDTDAGCIERQPKSAVMLLIQNGDKLLFQERLKHPHFGFWGLPTGKIRWGESIFETAARELMEETGLTADFEFRGLFHEHVRHAETNEVLEDKIFHVMFGHNLSGEMIEIFEGGRNVWMTQTEFMTQEKKYDSARIQMSFIDKAQMLIENVAIYGDDQF